MFPTFVDDDYASCDLTAFYSPLFAFILHPDKSMPPRRSMLNRLRSLKSKLCRNSDFAEFDKFGQFLKTSCLAFHILK